MNNYTQQNDPVEGESKEIPLTQGKVTTVDASDYEWLNQWKWHYVAKGYAARTVRSKGVSKHILMHRLVNETPDNLFTDHINGNKLDNRRCNLRTVTAAQNAYNKALLSTNSSGVRGVKWIKQTRKWRAEICLDREVKQLGNFKNIEDAERARWEAEREFFGEYSPSESRNEEPINYFDHISHENRLKELAVLKAVAEASFRPCELHAGWCPDGSRKCDACLVNEPLRTLLADPTYASFLAGLEASDVSN